MNLWTACRDDIILSFRRQKELAEKAMTQLDDELFFRKPGEHSNSIALIVKHVAGNLTSRWTDFLTTDGEKPDRDRDGEFVISPADTRANLLARWDRGFEILTASLQDLSEGDVTRTVTIRSEPHLVLQAIHRSLTHTSYHVGQIVYLGRLLKTDGWKWITIPPGESKTFNSQPRTYLESAAK